ncbi:MAG: hypothetical protein KDB70_20105 [Mycobacterium sp.]|jgi:hypothetical protein|nr:hypothetical protein [Mycobacterium sp.]
MSGEKISVKPGYPAAKTNLQSVVDGFTPAEGSRPADLNAAMDAATSSGTPSLARVIELLKAVAASAAEDHQAGVAALQSGMSTVNSWVGTLGGIDAAGGAAVTQPDTVTPTGPAAQLAPKPPKQPISPGTAHS